MKLLCNGHVGVEGRDPLDEGDARDVSRGIAWSACKLELKEACEKANGDQHNLHRRYALAHRQRTLLVILLYSLSADLFHVDDGHAGIICK